MRLKTQRLRLMADMEEAVRRGEVLVRPTCGPIYDVKLTKSGAVQWSVEGKRCSREDAYRFLVRCDHEWMGMPTTAASRGPTADAADDRGEGA